MRITTHLVSLIVVMGSIFIRPCLAYEPDSTRFYPFIYPDVEKPHTTCRPAECWDDCTDPGYENTCSQAASANVIYALCNFWCFPSPEEIYQDLINFTGNIGQYPEEEKQSMLDWVADNCPLCSLTIRIAHKGYADQNPVDPQNVTFQWADWGIPYAAHVKIWVVSSVQLPFPPAPTGRQDMSQELTYLGTTGNQALVHDSDCDRNGRGNNFYEIGSDEMGEYLKDYFGPGENGYLHGVIFVSGRH
jgi:hypothetical protein